MNTYKIQVEVLVQPKYSYCLPCHNNNNNNNSYNVCYAFCYSPYWIQSYQETFSDFKHMGLWEYCFDQFRYPYYQFDKLFDGCHYIFSQEYYVIREWLLPG